MIKVNLKDIFESIATKATEAIRKLKGRFFNKAFNLSKFMTWKNIAIIDLENEESDRIDLKIQFVEEEIEIRIESIKIELEKAFDNFKNELKSIKEKIK